MTTRVPKRIRRISLPIRAGLCLLVCSPVAAGIAWLFYRCGSATLQEPNPIPFAFATQRVDTTGVEITPVGSSGKVWLQANRQQHPDQDAMTQLLRKQGWKLQDVAGAERFYIKAGRTLRVYERM